MSEEEKKGNERGMYVFIAMCILGTGIGWSLGHIAIGAIIGTGIGFLALAYFNGKN